MTPNQIKNELKRMATSLKEKDIVKDFPSIVDDLKYIIESFDVEIKGLTEEQRINHIYDIETYRVDYLAELMRKYMSLKWNKKFSYEIVAGYLFSSTAGYNQRDDVVTISIFGMILNSDSVSDYIKSITHEYRHQLQYRFLHEKDIKGMLDYPPYFITIAKNMIPKDIKVVTDEFGQVIEKPYYNDNYKNIYMEVDANNYGVEVVKTFLSDLYSMYPDKNEELNKKVDELQRLLLIQGINTKIGLEKEGRLNQVCLDEIYTEAPITSKVMVNGEKKDALLYTDKTIKDNPVISEVYEVIKVLMHDYGFKSYWQLLLDKFKAEDQYKDQKSKVEEIYNNIIKSDPIAIITRLVTEKDKEGIKSFIELHPTFIEEYKDEINTMFNQVVAEPDIINLLTPEDCDIIVKERK